MNIVVLGAAGFVGSNLTARLLEEGHTVIAVDNLCTGKLENLLGLARHNNFTFAHGSIEEFVPPASFIVDVVFNLASPASPAYYFDSPVKTMSANTTGVLKTLEWATRDEPIVIYSSTSEVYGDPTHPYQSEEMLGQLPLMSPRACYDYSKKFAEVAHYQYKRCHGLDTRIVRLFNTYGPKMDKDDGRVVSSFLFAAAMGEKLTVHDSGQQARSFMYISDLVEALYQCMLVERGWDGALNIGNPVERSILELTDHIRALYPDVEIDFSKGYPNDPKRRCPDIDKAKDLLGWTPKVGLTEGLQLTNEWVQQQDDVFLTQMIK